jgi:predicted membrane protein
MKHRNWFWGILFIAAAVLVIASQFTSFAQIGFWSILVGVLLAAVFIQSLVNLNYFGIFASLAFGYYFFQQSLHLIYISPWLLILATILLSIGFQSIFKVRPNTTACHHDTYCNDNEEDYRTIEDVSDNNPYVKVSFGASSKYLHADALRGGQFYCSCGTLEVYFDQVRLDPDGAEIFIDCSLGEMKLFFPKSWCVNEKLSSGLGGVNNSFRSKPQDSNAPTITVTGNVSLGSLFIGSI